MQRLTGIDLYNHHNNFVASESDLLRLKTKKVISAGYTEKKKDGSDRVCFFAYYEALNKVKRWIKAKKNTEDNGGRKVTKNIIEALKNRRNSKKRNDEVYYSEEYDASYVYFYGSPICVIYWHDKILHLSEVYRSKSTKERLNRILMALTGCQLYQKNKEWYVYSPIENKDILFRYGLDVNFLGPCPE